MKTKYNTKHDEVFNIALGKRLEFLRNSRKMSQDYLGACLGVRGQQINKYEAGENRVPPARLAMCARIFDVPVGYFYGELDNGEPKYYDKTVMNVAAEVNTLPPDIRQCVYNLSRVINKSWAEFFPPDNDNDNEKGNE